MNQWQEKYFFFLERERNKKKFESAKAAWEACYLEIRFAEFAYFSDGIARD